MILAGARLTKAVRRVPSSHAGRGEGRGRLDSSAITVATAGMQHDNPVLLLRCGLCAVLCRLLQLCTRYVVLLSYPLFFSRTLPPRLKKDMYFSCRTVWLIFQYAHPHTLPTNYFANVMITAAPSDVGHATDFPPNCSSENTVKHNWSKCHKYKPFNRENLSCLKGTLPT